MSSTSLIIILNKIRKKQTSTPVVPVPPVTNAMLLETGDYMLLETGDYMLLE